MKLYEAPRNCKIRIVPGQDNGVMHPPAHRAFEEGEVLHFAHVDGMYSLCRDKDGKIVHLKAWTEVEVVRDA